MSTVTTVFAILVALEHIYIMFLETIAEIITLERSKIVLSPRFRVKLS